MTLYKFLSKTTANQTCVWWRILCVCAQERGWRVMIVLMMNPLLETTQKLILLFQNKCKIKHPSKTNTRTAHNVVLSVFMDVSGSQLVHCVCVAIRWYCRSGLPCKGDVWGLFGVWTWQVSSLQPAHILYGSSLQSYHILYGRNNKLSGEKRTACHCTCCQ